MLDEEMVIGGGYMSVGGVRLKYLDKYKSSNLRNWVYSFKIVDLRMKDNTWHTSDLNYISCRISLGCDTSKELV